jgi:hypothetical protein
MRENLEVKNPVSPKTQAQIGAPLTMLFPVVNQAII